MEKCDKVLRTWWQSDIWILKFLKVLCSKQKDTLFKILIHETIKIHLKEEVEVLTKILYKPQSIIIGNNVLMSHK